MMPALAVGLLTIYTVVAFTALCALYFLPTLLRWSKYWEKEGRWGFATVNLLVGWTVIGWLALLGWLWYRRTETRRLHRFFFWLYTRDELRAYTKLEDLPLLLEEYRKEGK